MSELSPSRSLEHPGRLLRLDKRAIRRLCTTGFGIDPARHGGDRSDSAPVHPQQRPTPGLPGVRRCLAYHAPAGSYVLRASGSIRLGTAETEAILRPQRRAGKQSKWGSRDQHAGAAEVGWQTHTPRSGSPDAADLGWC